MNNCTFCKIYKKREEIIYEDEYFFINFDLFPVSPGHIEIIPKRHIVSFFDLSKDEWNKLQETFLLAIKIINESNLEEIYKNFIKEPLNEKSKEYCENILQSDFLKRKPDGYNIGINEGEAAERTIHHLHIHIIPRFDRDVKNPIGGIRNIFPEIGNYK